MSAVAGSDPRTEEFASLRPQVALAGRDLPVWLLAALALAFALGLFLVLDGKRQARLAGDFASRQVVNLPPPPPLLAVPRQVERAEPDPVSVPLPGAYFAPPPGERSIASPPPMIRPAQRRPVDDIYAPPRFRTETSPVINAGSSSGRSGGLVIDLTAGKGATINGGAAGAAGNASVETDDDAVRATILRNRSSLVPQGVIIAAVLETPLNSDRPGMARALVSKDVSGFDGNRVLIPRGSRLIGEFKADNSPGMRRILVNWVRLIRPDGVTIRIGSPSSDQLGGAGIPGKVNTHFFERFLGAVLQSSLMVGVNVASQIPNDGNNVYIGLPNQVGQVGQDLIPDTDRPPTVKVPAGAQIAIFVAHDLDFGGTPAVR